MNFERPGPAAQKAGGGGGGGDNHLLGEITNSNSPGGEWLTGQQYNNIVFCIQMQLACHLTRG